jgi:hypothetical protein
MNIKLTTEKRIVTRPEEIKLIKEITINQIIDNSFLKKVIANTKEAGAFLLWSGSEYDEIGQWTDTDVVNRINELLNN